MRTARPFALLLVPALVTGLALPPAGAATSATCAPTTVTERDGLVVSGASTPLRSQSVTVTSDGGGTATATGMASIQGTYSVTVPTGALSNGLLTAVVTESAPTTATPQQCTATLALPATPVLIEIEPSPITLARRATVVVRGTLPSSQAGATVTATAVDASRDVLGQPTPQSATGSGPVAGDGTFAVTVDTSALQDGAIGVTATATSPIGFGRSNPSNRLDTTKDTVPPAQPGAATATDTTQASPRTTVAGSVAADVTRVQVTLSKAGSPVTVTESAVPSGNAYSVPVDASTLPEGSVLATVTAFDAAGNPSPTRGASFLKDHVGPDVIDLTADDATLATDGKVFVAGQTGESSTTVTITVTDRNGMDVVQAATPHPVAPGAFTRDVDVAPLAEGPLTVTAVAKDSKGNTGPSPDPVTATKDTVAPLVTALAAAATNAASATLSVTGSTEAGSTVVVTASTGATTRSATLTAGPDGAFQAEITPTGLADGAVVVRATATDPVGNAGPTAETTAARDTSEPVVTGLVATVVNGETPDGASTVTGTTEPGSTVAITVTDRAGATATTTATAGPDGRFSATLPLVALVDGPVTVDATATDPAGNPGPTARTTTVKDLQGPTVSITSAEDANRARTVVAVTGVVSEAGSSVRLAVTDGTTTVVRVLTGLVGTDFATTLDLATLRDGTDLRLTATVTDAAGNVGGFDERLVSKDTVAPVLTGLAATDVRSGQLSTTVTGLSDPGQSIALRLRQGGVELSQTVTAGPDGAFTSAASTEGFTDGTVEVTAAAVDSAGNPSTAQTSFAKDVTPPLLVGLGATGTSQPSPRSVVTGTTDPGQVVTLTATQGSRTVTGEATGAADGTFRAELDLTAFDDGVVTVTASAVDQAGNTTTAATTTAKDSTGPLVATLSATDTRVDRGSTTVTGTTDPGSSVTVTAARDASTASAVVSAAPDGGFTATLDLAGFPQGPIPVTAVASDGVNSGPATSTTSLRDTVAPQVSALVASEPTAEVPALVAAGITEGGSTVAVTVRDASGRTATGSGVAGGDGRFAVGVDASALADGPLTVTAVATDPVGNAGGPTSAESSKDASRPTVSGLEATDVSAAGSVTTVTGTISESGTALAVVVTDGTATVTRQLTGPRDTSLSTTLDVAALADGTLTVRVTATDAAGNVGPTATTTLRKDTVLPVLTALAATPATGAQPRTTVTGSSEPGQPVTVTVTAGAATATASGVAGSDGAFSVVVDVSALPDGPLAVRVTATDAVGNASAATTATTKDATAPGLTGLAATGTTAATPATTVTGTTEPGQAVVVTASQGERTLTDAVTAGSDGAFAAVLDLSSFADGVVTITAVATDAAGNAATATTTSPRDTAGPDVTELAASTSTAGAQTSTVTGRTEPGATVALTARSGTGVVTGSATAGSDGRFSAPLDLTALPDGTVTTTAVARDGVGNSGAAASTTAARDTVLPLISGLAASASSASTPGSTVTGATEPGSSVAVTATDGRGGSVAGNAVAGDNGGFSVVLDLSGLQDGPVTVTARATDPVGNAGPAASTATARTSVASRYIGLPSPARVLDSRPGSDNVGVAPGKKQGAVLLDLSGQLPEGALSAVLNVTVTAPDRPGFVVVHPAGTPQPPTSNVNFAAGQTQANEVVTGLSSARAAVVVIDSAGPSHVIVDLVGYFTSENGPGGYVVPLTPKRVLGNELRTNLGSSVGSSSIEVDLNGSVPTGSTGAILNVTVAGPTESGFVVAYPSGIAQPSTSNVNFGRGQTQANEVVTQIGSNGRVRLTLSRGTARLVVDVVGAVVPASVAGSGRFTALAAPVRVLDTRDGTGTTGTTRRSAFSPATIAMPSVVPSDATGVVLNVTSTGSTAAGFVVVYPGGSAQPPTSNVNFRTGQNQANEVVVALGPGRSVTLSIGGSGAPTTHLVADVVGFLR